MKIILCHIGFLLAALIVGQILIGFGIPFTMQFIGGHMPMNLDPAAFGHFIFIRPLLLWLAAGCAAVPGIFIYDDARLRRAILTMPIWAPMTYVMCYVILVWQ